jgi:DNA-binding MarR family transcriptional regulator
MLEVACLCTNLRRAARAITELYDAALAPSGLKVTQFSLMRAVDRLEAPSISEVAAATGLDRSTLGRNLRVLARDGLVGLGAGADERARLVSLTDKGRAALETAEPLWLEAQARAASAIPPEEAAPLDHALVRLAALPSDQKDASP